MIVKRLFNDGWEFSKQKVGTGIEGLGSFKFERVNVPHDWLIYQTADLYESAVGYYRKKFEMKKRAGRRYEIYFEGVYMDSVLFVNGEKAGEWKYGYSSFFFDITENLKDGENEIVVQVNHLSPNSRWYSGAGIFRDVYFIENAETHIVTDSLYVSAKPFVNEGEEITKDTDLSKEWEITVSADIANGKADCDWNKSYPAGALKPISKRLKLTLWFPSLGRSHSALIGVATKEEREDGSIRVELKEKVEAPELWSMENPKLYDCVLTIKDPEAEYEKEEDTTAGIVNLPSDKAKISLQPGEPEGDKARTLFGFRSFVYDVNKGMFINGKHVKLNGVCEHHDLGCIGAAFNKTGMRRKYMKLREMGVNAIRTSHNMSAVSVLDLADELGFVVMNESFDCWESGKTEFDYGRFFKEWEERDVRSWVRRDRNHPSVFMWSIGNEIYDTHKDAHGQEITRTLKQHVEENDFYGMGVVGIGSNYMPWENAQKCSDILKFAGYNYAEKFYDEHHKAHPDWHIFGSETSSTVQSRGVYHFPYERSCLADDNQQCSSLGNSTTSWGARSTESCIIAERDHEFSIGQFLWTGFDYIGEPTPYQTRNSYFGQVDTCGFEKDAFYVYKSAWVSYKDDPFVHIFPYWDFNEGQLIDVRVASNAPEIELFLNGKSLGRKKIDHEKGTVLTGNYKVLYEKGEVTAVAYDENGKEIARTSNHSFGDTTAVKASVMNKPEKYYAGCGDLAFVALQAYDKDGYPVENANDLIKVNGTGAGWLTGLDNGDSTDTDEYKGNLKRLFNGKMLAVIAIGDSTGEIKVSFESEGIKGDEVVIAVEGKRETLGISLIPENFETIGYRTAKSEGVNTKRLRKIDIVYSGEKKITPETNSVKVNVKLYPESAGALIKDEDIIWKVVNDDGIESNISKITEKSKESAVIKAVGDGHFRLRVMSKCGCNEAKVISEYEFDAEGFGAALLDPYSLIAGGLYTYQEGEIGIGNEHGVSTARLARSVVGFEKVDFGEYGSDEITIPIFSLSDDEFKFEVWEGIPEKDGSVMVLDGKYRKPMIWNVYQSETYKLTKRLKGITDVYFVAHDKVHIGGFYFTKQIKAFSLLNAGECDNVYGDSFEKKEDRIDKIGNNVTVEFGGMDFGEKAAKSLTITGHTPNKINTIHVLFESEEGNKRDILEFSGEGDKSQTFPVSDYTGKGTVRFVFLPGSNFDFESFRFE